MAGDPAQRLGEEIGGAEIAAFQRKPKRPGAVGNEDRHAGIDLRPIIMFLRPSEKWPSTRRHPHRLSVRVGPEPAMC